MNSPASCLGKHIGFGPNALDNIKEVSKDEVAEQLKRLKKGKGTDDDEGVVAEMLKYSGEEVEHEIAKIYNCAMRGSEEVPQY